MKCCFHRGRQIFTLAMVMAGIFFAISIITSAATTSINISTAKKPQLTTPIQTRLHFEPNQGQLEKKTRFQAQGQGYTIRLNGNTTEFQLSNQSTQKSAIIEMAFLGAKKDSLLKGKNKLPGVIHRYRGTEKPFLNIPTYSQLTSKDIYPGIDVVYYGNNHELEYDFIVEAGTDPEVINLSFSGTKKLKLNEQGDLVLTSNGGDLVQRAPVSYQDIDGKRIPVSVTYELNPKKPMQVALNVGQYNADYPLTIDPVLSYASYLGTAEQDRGTGIGVSAAGDIFVALDTYIGGGSKLYIVTVKKFSPAGTELYSTELLNTTAITASSGLVVSSTGEVAIAGYTIDSTVVPITAANAPQTTHGDGGLYEDGWVIALDPAGTVNYATYLGGDWEDQITGISTDDTALFITGTTVSNTFPTTGTAFDITCGDPVGGGTDCASTGIYTGFVATLDPGAATGALSLVYSSFYGGTGGDLPNAIAPVQGKPGEFVIAGYTGSDDLPTVTPYNSTLNGTGDGFIAAFDPSQTGAATLTYGTYLGSSDAGVSEEINAVTTDGTFLYVTGYTTGSDFPITASAYNINNSGGYDVFVTKLDPGLTGAAQLVYSTYFGGTGDDTPPFTGFPAGGYGNAIGTYGPGKVVIGGNTYSADFPFSVDADQPAGISGSDGYMAIIDTNAANAASLVYSSYFSGDGVDYISDIFTLSDGTSFFTGSSTSTTLVTTVDADQLANAGSEDSFIAKLSTASTGADVSVSMGSNFSPVPASTSFDYTLSLNNAGPDQTDVTLVITVDASMTITNAVPLTECAGFTATVATCNWTNMGPGANFPVTITTTSSTTPGTYSASAVATTVATDPDTQNNTANYDIDVTSDVDLAITMAPVTTTVNVGQPIIYNVTVTNNSPTAANNVVIDNPIPGFSSYDAGSSDASCSLSASVTCYIPTIAASGGFVTIPIAFFPGSGDVGTLVNTASVTADEFDPNTADNVVNDNTVTVADVTADVGITLITPSVATATVGDTITYTVDIINNGTGNATNVTVDNALPAGVTFAAGTSSAFCVESVPGTVSCDFGSVTNAGTASGVIAVTLTPASAGSISSTMFISATETDPTAANDSAVTPAVTVNAAVDLGITLSGGPDPSVVGDTITYTATVTNFGPNDGEGATVTDVLPAGATFVSATPSQGAACTGTTTVTCDLGAILWGDSATVTITVTANVAAAGTLTNTASVAVTTGSTDVDNNATNDLSTLPISVKAAIDLGITLGVIGAPDPPFVGGNVVYTATITNAGPNNTSAATFTDVLPAGVTFVSATPSQGAACTGTTTVTCDLGAIASAGNATVTLTVTANAAAAGTLSNSASVAVTTGNTDVDANATNDTASANIAVDSTSDTSLVIGAATADPIAVTQSTVLPVTLSNAGPNTATGVTLTATLPAGITLDTANSSASCSESAGTLICTAGNLASGGNTVINVGLTAGAAATSFSVTLSVFSDSLDPATANNTATSAVITVTPAIDLDVVITVPTTAPIKSTYTYDVKVTNNGPSNATGVVIINTLDPNVTFDAASSDASCGAGVSCTIGALAAGASKTITIGVTAGTTAAIVSNAISATGTEADIDASNNSKTLTTELIDTLCTTDPTAPFTSPTVTASVAGDCVVGVGEVTGAGSLGGELLMSGVLVYGIRRREKMKPNKLRQPK